jgi:hypothetical protein
LSRIKIKNVIQVSMKCIHSILRECGNWYIGETDRPLDTKSPSTELGERTKSKITERPRDEASKCNGAREMLYKEETNSVRKTEEDKFHQKRE